MTAQYDIDDDFFKDIDGLIERGQIHTTLKVEGNARTRFNLHIHSVGTVTVPCDRCLAEVEIPVDTTDDLTVKLGAEYSDEGDMVIIPESDGYINIAQFIYEYIVLSLPIQKVHEPGGCDAATIEALQTHIL